MEYAVAEARECRAAQQDDVTVAEPEAQRAGAQTRESADQAAAGAVPIDDEAGQRLATTRNDEEHGHDEAEFGVGIAVVRFQPRKQRRDDQVEEMTQAVRNPDQADNPRVTGERHGIERARCDRINHARCCVAAVAGGECCAGPK